MEISRKAPEASQQSQTQPQSDVHKGKRIKISLENLKMPSASDSFKARVTCQRRS